MQWKVVPLSKGQLKDIRPEDILENGHFRKCSTYRGGGGYDKFPEYCEKFTGKRYSEQFVVQLFGCNLDCPYCYVTRAGVWGKWLPYTTVELVEAFQRSEQEIFHLMGGAPALQIDNWSRIIEKLSNEVIFHSDLMLVEKTYSQDTLKRINQENCIYAVGIKGLTGGEFLTNTRKAFNIDRFQRNLERVLKTNLQMYFTFTNVSKLHREQFMKQFPQYDSFHIDLIDYEASSNVDDVPWGKQKPVEV